MKNIITLVVSIIILLVFGIWQINYLDTSAKFATSDVYYIKSLVQSENFDLAEKHIDELKNTWDNMKGLWSIFINHDEIDDIEESVVDLKEYIKVKDKEEALVSIAQVIQNFEHIPKRQEVRLENIF